MARSAMLTAVFLASALMAVEAPVPPGPAGARPSSIEEPALVIPPPGFRAAFCSDRLRRLVVRMVDPTLPDPCNSPPAATSRGRAR